MFEKIFGSEEDEELVRLKKKIEEKKREIEGLQKEISELNEKLQRSKEKLEREKERAKKAVTEKQESDKELKRTKHKIESLEDRVENLKEQTREGKRTKESRFLTREETLALLDELEGLKSDRSSLVTHYLEDPEKVGDKEVLRVLRNIDSQTGYVYLRDQFKILNCILLPPFPVKSEFYREERLKLEKIKEILNSELEICFISIHAGKSAVGLLEGREFRSFDLIKSQVKSKHSKGGFSQGRFERRRDEQIQKHLDKVCKHVEESVEGVDYLVLDGAKKLKSELMDRFSVNIPLIEKSLDIGKIRKSEKEKYAEKIWGTRLYIF